MNVIKTDIPDVLIFEPKVFSDSRGYFYESFNQSVFENAIGHPISFCQDNHSMSYRGVIRGLHYQTEPFAQGKLVRCVVGEVFDVAVDLRRTSKTFGQWVSVNLSAENKRQLWIPEGFAHGFMALSEAVEFVYKTTQNYSAANERCIIWDDPMLAIKWPELDCEKIVSHKDLLGDSFLNYQNETVNSEL